MEQKQKTLPSPFCPLPRQASVPAAAPLRARRLPKVAGRPSHDTVHIVNFASGKSYSPPVPTAIFRLCCTATKFA
jgi:hypothetical protein